MNIVEKIETMAARLERAREIARLGLIYPIYGDEERRYVCKSQSDQTDGNGQVKLYLVGEKSCTCADFRKLSQVNGGWCKHRLAREILIQKRSAISDQLKANEGGDHAESGVPNKSDGDLKQTQRRRAVGIAGGDWRGTVRAGSGTH